CARGYANYAMDFW
nr:immunoglobulin heavy chain junction region [Mus musculus]